MRSLSQKTKYALRALQFLAKQDGHGPILISTLAEREEIPKKFLELILLELKNAGILHSKKGKGGGYFLRKPADEISLGEVIRIFDGAVEPLSCVGGSAFMKCEDCKDETTCGIRYFMQEVRDVTNKILDATSIADVLKRIELLEREKRRGAGMYHI